MTVFKAACVQLRSSDDVAENIRETVRLVREAAAQGASFIATPENTTLMAPDGGAKLARSYDEAQDPALPVFSALAKELKIWLLIGSLAIKISQTKTANRSFLFAPDGQLAARYSKLHLFDVTLASGEAYRESDTVEGGGEAVLAETAWGKIGLSVCYDVRFPLLYRQLAQKARFCSPSHRPSRCRPARRIGMFCSGRAPSRMAPLCWRRRRAACTPTAAKPMAIA